MTTPSQTKAWFKAAARFDTQQMREMMANGVSINALDARGQTALFYVVAPWGGQPEAVEWLIKHGVDVNVRDASGKSAVQLGHAHVSSALEANIARQNAHLCRQAGYVDDVIELRQTRSRARRSGRRRRNGPQASDFFGHWRVASGDDEGAELHIGAWAIKSDVDRLALTVSGRGFSPSEQMWLDGEHDGELVHVSLTQIADGDVRLVRTTGVTAITTVHLERPAE